MRVAGLTPSTHPGRVRPFPRQVAEHAACVSDACNGLCSAAAAAAAAAVRTSGAACSSEQGVLPRAMEDKLLALSWAWGIENIIVNDPVSYRRFFRESASASIALISESSPSKRESRASTSGVGALGAPSSLVFASTYSIGGGTSI